MRVVLEGDLNPGDVGLLLLEAGAELAEESLQLLLIRSLHFSSGEY